jgi:hypothetical protein
MKYMILLYGSQQDYDALTGKQVPGKPAWGAEDFAAMGAFMTEFTKGLAESGELVETRGLTAPVHARRIELTDGVPVRCAGTCWKWPGTAPRRCAATRPRPVGPPASRSSAICKPAPPAWQRSD